MTKRHSYRPFILLILFLTACSTIEMQYYRIPEKINIIQKIKTDFVPKKCLYSSINKTAFVLEKEANIIHIYKNGKKINTIGGLGFTSTSFNKLADITLSPDGNLLALDSFQKKIKKFDIDGKLIAELNLNDFIEPALLAVAIDETYYIYDNAFKEIIITRTFGQSDWYTFGKFQLNNPSKINLGKNEIMIYDKLKNSTLIFGILGRFQNEIDGNIQIEKQQQYILKNYFIYHPKSDSKFAISTNKWNDFSIEDNVILLSDNEIWIGKLTYSEPKEK
ncbi:MAG: 6-bladed beta-propeller [Candidatus Cloacimonadota bacterium]|nr:6-bladed beta-propeller [Candidatus Cloacimonadota bacterium]